MTRRVLFKDNLQAYWQLFKGIFTVVRVLAFEKFTPVFFFFYLICVLSMGFVLSVVHWSIAVVVVLIGVLLFVKVLNRFQFLKRSLIRKGDRVEYVDPNTSDTAQMFKKATITLKMRPDEVKKSKLISEELIEGNKHFYLVQRDKQPTVIAFDWIIGLSPELLEIEFND